MTTSPIDHRPGRDDLDPGLAATVLLWALPVIGFVLAILGLG